MPSMLRIPWIQPGLDPSISRHNVPEGTSSFGRGIRSIWSGLDIGVFLNCGRIPGVPLEFQVETISS